MPGVLFPDSYAMTLEARRGTHDAAYLKRQKELQKPAETASALASRDVSGCPDCAGTGFWYPAGDTPEGRAQGTAKCRHARLGSGSEPVLGLEAASVQG